MSEDNPRTIDDLFEINQNDSFNRFSGFLSLQTNTAYFAMEDLLNKRSDIVRIVEFGTCEGGFTLFLGLHMRTKKGQMLTLDTQTRQDPKWFELAKLLGIEFFCDDIFSPEAEKKIIEFIQQPGTTLVFCDNGNKPHEVSHYAKHLKPGDLILAHDWMTEIKPEDVESLSDILEPYNQTTFDNLKTRIMCRVRK